MEAVSEYNIIKKQLKTILARESLIEAPKKEEREAGFYFNLDNCLYSQQPLWFMSILLYKKLISTTKLCHPDVVCNGGEEASECDFLISSLMNLSYAMGSELESVFINDDGTLYSTEYESQGVDVAMILPVYSKYEHLLDQIKALHKEKFYVTKIIPIVFTPDDERLAEDKEKFKSNSIDLDPILTLNEISTYKVHGDPKKEEEEEEKEQQSSTEEEEEEL